ncbi:MAG: cache domain-containing protein [Saprospiraceae bacterium]
MSKRIVYALAVLVFAALVYQAFSFYQFEKERNTFVIEKGLSTTQALRNKVDTILQIIVSEGDRLAERFGSEELDDVQIRDIIRQSARSIPELQGVTACYEPFSFRQNQQLYCPYYDKGNSNYIQVEDSYDYTVKGAGTAWYTGPRDNGASWAEPYYAKAAQDWYIDYGVPFYYRSGPNKGKVRGTITMSFVAGGFKDIVHKLSVGKTGYGLISSAKGNLLAHPHEEYIGVRDLDFLNENETALSLKSAYTAMSNGETGSISFYDETQRDEALFFYDKIPSSNWSIGLAFFKNDMLGDTQNRDRILIRLGFLLSLFIILIFASYFIKDYLDEQEIWILSILGSILLLGLLVFVGYLQHRSQDIQTKEETAPIVDVASLGSFTYSLDERADERKVPRPTAVPTGIFINRMTFENSYDLSVGGKVWQKYPLSIVDDVDIGFDFPQMSPFAEASYIEEVNRDTVPSKEGEDGYLLVTWDVRVTLTLNLKYADYPFDKRHLSLQITPLNNRDRLVFTPDLGSYSFTNPSRKSGLNPNIRISGNQVMETYFNYTVDTYESDFGYGDKSLYEGVPTLRFNINLKRDLLNSFVTYLIPIVVSLLMMFILIYAVHKSAERQGVIESMAAFFFVLIFSHIDMRKEIITADLIYLEYFYFITYFMVILSTANLIVYTKDKSDIFDFNENQIYKAVYFPLFLFLILVVTLVKFY